MFRRAEVVEDDSWEPPHEVAEGEPFPPEPPPHVVGDLDALLSTRPCFRGALRGYDRMQVDNYVAWAEAELVAARRRSDHLLARYGACQAELQLFRRLLAQTPGGRELSSVSDRVAEVLRLAADEAAGMTAAGVQEAERILAEARLEADARLRKAHEIRQSAVAVSIQLREQARELRDATAERDRVAGEAAEAWARLAGMADEVDELRRQRDEARELLRRLADQIGQALDAVSAVVPNERVIMTGNVVQQI